MDLKEIENRLIDRLLIALAKRRYPDIEITPAGFTDTLEQCITRHQIDEKTSVVMLWFNVGKNGCGERMKFELKPT